MPAACLDGSHSLVGQSSQIGQIARLIEKFSRSRTPVLVLGETGTGKEVVARALHSACPEGAFVPIDCGSLVGQLMESELFGHTKGAFTGAIETTRGLIEMANGGTAFFDEIGDLPLEMQVKLLRVLQEREYRPVGSVIRHKVNIRVIAATHRDLRKEVARGAFREDLFFRLNVSTIRVPPLRDHKEDIPELIEYFLTRMGKRYTLTKESLDAILAYDWPGNVRQLENCIAHMVALSSGPLLHTMDLPSPLQNQLAAETGSQLVLTAAAARGGGVAHVEATPPASVLPLAEVEKRAILGAIEFTRGDCTIAAEMLGIGRTTLYRKLKEYRLSPKE